MEFFIFMLSTCYKTGHLSNDTKIPQDSSGIGTITTAHLSHYRPF